MHTNDKELIQSKLNEWFKGIRKKLNSEKNLTSTRISEAQEIELDQFIQRKWDDFRETFKCTIHKFSSIERREYIEPYRVCRRVNILRDYPDDKTKLYPRN
ncbi:hypothetical protein [Acinetobacter baumannii]|uniref:hypothetical protein n=1 Tax=Acinetobacter baumannii TaxID=470 RepID=UPI001C849E11|nr:hypothetical protein [Acinetobacter baumannii]BCZ16206.1 hypothetical protein OCUAc18_37460 [Acinetobacter baumannii]